MKQRGILFKEEILQYHVIGKVMDVPIRNQYGDFLMAAFSTSASGLTVEHLVLYKDVSRGVQDAVIPVRINSACLTGEVFGCDRCDCKWQLDEAIRYIASVGFGLVIYHPGHEGRGFGLVTKLKSYMLMDTGLSTAQAFRSLGIKEDGRRFLSSVLVLKEFGIDRVNLLTNNPKKIEVLQALGIAVEKVTPLVMPTTDPRIRQYLRSKRDELGHIIPEGDV